MKHLSIPALFILISQLGACGATVAPSTSVEPISLSAPEILSQGTTHSTILLVTLDNGSVIMQTINASADLCFKRSSDSSTACLTQGEAVMDPATNTVIGFEMIEDNIDLIAKSY
ncbi:MAG: hypothetical protein QNK16_00635 [Woeseiaceae bacterium]|nr:hypothetical protein [Woeseiaceae bacterium]MDX2606863.1 hypothetical protein [Woeseiaceae bacterium]